jgi:hypothetical protein
VNRLRNILDKDSLIKDNTLTGYVESTFDNDAEIKALGYVPMGVFFDKIDHLLKEYYHG